MPAGFRKPAPRPEKTVRNGRKTAGKNPQVDINIDRSRYFGNATFGRETVLPILRGLADFWRCWLQRQPTEDGGYVLVDNDDNMSEQVHS